MPCVCSKGKPSRKTSKNIKERNYELPESKTKTQPQTTIINSILLLGI